MEGSQNNTVSEPNAGRKMFGMIWTIAAVIIVAAAGWYAFKNSDRINLPESGSSQSASEQAVEDPVLEAILNAEDGTLPPGIVREFTIIGQNYRFSPSEMRARKGETVRVIFKSSDMTHDWRIDELGLATKILPAGQQETLEFVAEQAGEFEYYCSVGDHKTKGMIGKLIVEE